MKDTGEDWDNTESQKMYGNLRSAEECGGIWQKEKSTKCLKESSHGGEAESFFYTDNFTVCDSLHILQMKLTELGAGKFDSFFAHTFTRPLKSTKESTTVLHTAFKTKEFTTGHQVEMKQYTSSP